MNDNTCCSHTLKTSNENCNELRRRNANVSKVNELIKRDLLRFEDAPPYMRGNPYITAHYRANYTITECLYSVFEVHSETMNIWTSILGFMVNFCCFAWVLVNAHDLFHISSSAPPTPPFGKTVALPMSLAEIRLTTFFFVCFMFHFLSRLICWIFSFLAHCFTAHSEDAHRFCFKLDYFGIYFSMIGMAGNMNVLETYCKQHLHWAVMTMVTSQIITIFISRFRFFNGPNFRLGRSFVFAWNGAFVFYPVCSAWSADGAPAHSFYLFACLACTVWGGTHYAALLPERLAPGRFNVWGHSHQIWHFVFAIFDYCWFRLCLDAYLSLKRKHFLC